MSTQFIIDATAGTIGGVAGVLVGEPLDVIKVHCMTEKHPWLYVSAHTFSHARLQTRVQNDTNMRPHAVRAILRDTLRNESIHGLYRGARASALSQAPTNFIAFGVYGTVQKWLDEAEAGKYLGVSPSSRSLLNATLAGSISGTAAAFALAPFEHVKVQQQMMKKRGEPHMGIAGTVRSIVNAGGPLHLMRGTAATVVRDSVSVGIYFGAYELSKAKLGRLAGVPEGTSPPDWILLTAGGAAGVASWLPLPLDVIKSVIQGSAVTAPRSETAMISVARRLHASGGVAAFFK